MSDDKSHKKKKKKSKKDDSDETPVVQETATPAITSSSGDSKKRKQAPPSSPALPSTNSNGNGNGDDVQSLRNDINELKSQLAALLLKPKDDTTPVAVATSAPPAAVTATPTKPATNASAPSSSSSSSSAKKSKNTKLSLAEWNQAHPLPATPAKIAINPSAPPSASSFNNIRSPITTFAPPPSAPTPLPLPPPSPAVSSSSRAAASAESKTILSPNSNINISGMILSLLQSQIGDYERHLMAFTPSSSIVMVATMDHLEIVARELAVWPLLALDVEGVNLSRTGRITILQIATPRTIYCIDIVALTATVSTTKMINGVSVAISLRPRITTLLNSFLANGSSHPSGRLPRILVWDARNDSDALYHQLGVTLGSVLDLQLLSVAHQRFVKKLQCDNRPGLAKAVDSVFADRVRSYDVQALSVKVHAEFEAVRAKNVPESQHPWVVRPLRPDLQLYSAFGVLFHLPLAYRLWDSLYRHLSSVPITTTSTQPMAILANLDWAERTLVASATAVIDFRDRVVAVRRGEHSVPNSVATGSNAIVATVSPADNTKIAPLF